METTKYSVVISQPMYFPWPGMLEQIALADRFVFYSDVQFARGFYNRVQVKTSAGIVWMTVPLAEQHRGQLISEVKVDYRKNWQAKHLNLLKESFRQSPYAKDALALCENVWSARHLTLGDLAKCSMRVLSDYFDLSSSTHFYDSAQMDIFGKSTQRLIDLSSALNAKTYITGHGAANYLNHEAFEQAGIDVAYMQYQCKPYSQAWGTFTPYVTSLDLVANLGKAGRELLCSEYINWRAFLYERTR